jgi:hypothetical protein
MEQEKLNTPQNQPLQQTDVRRSYYWYCRFTFMGDKRHLYLTERNDCETFKQFRKWWRKEKPNLKLISAVRK